MTQADKIVKAVLEVEEGDEENLQDLLGHDYALAEPVPQGLPAEVDVHDRWKDVKIGDVHFCISYLTPVAVYRPGLSVFLTDKQWSSSTSNHIRKWYNMLLSPPTGEYSYKQIRKESSTMPQSELTELFRKQSRKALWTKKQSRQIERLPSNMERPLKSGHEERVSVQPHEPEE